MALLDATRHGGPSDIVRNFLVLLNICRVIAAGVIELDHLRLMLAWVWTIGSEMDKKTNIVFAPLLSAVQGAAPNRKLAFFPENFADGGTQLSADTHLCQILMDETDVDGSKRSH